MFSKWRRVFHIKLATNIVFHRVHGHQRTSDWSACCIASSLSFYTIACLDNLLFLICISEAERATNFSTDMLGPSNLHRSGGLRRSTTLKGDLLNSLHNYLWYHRLRSEQTLTSLFVEHWWNGRISKLIDDATIQLFRCLRSVTSSTVQTRYSTSIKRGNELVREPAHVFRIANNLDDVCNFSDFKRNVFQEYSQDSHENLSGPLGLHIFLWCFRLPPFPRPQKCFQ